MSRILATLFTLPLMWALGAQAPPHGPTTLRVLTYNIHHGEGTDGILDLARVAEVIRTARADIIALQEVDQATERSGGVNQLDELARMTGMHAEFGKAIDYMNGDYGVAVLSRWPLLRAENRPLSTAPDREPRTALTVQVRPAGGPLLQFTSTHLDNGRDEESRLSQAADLDELGRKAHLPALLGGDFNARPDTDAMKVVNREWTNGLILDQLPAAPDGRPRVRGDFVLFKSDNRWRVIESAIMEDRLASDHRPVLVVMELH